MKVEELKLFLEESKMCSYEIAMNLAKDTNVIIGDYNYAFHPFVQSTILNKIQKELEDLIIIIDEAHNLPTRITDMLSHSLNSNMIKNALIEAKKFRYDGLLIWLQEIMRILTHLGDFSKTDEKEHKIEKIEFIQRVKNFTDYDNLIEEIQLAADEIRKKQQRSYLSGIASFLQAWKGEDEGYVRSITEKRSKIGPIISLNYDCLDPRVITKDIFSRIHAGVLMSGTLQPLFMYKDVLGIESEKSKLGEYPSPFPPENKITLIVPETTTKYTLRNPVMYQQIAKKCSEFAKLIPGNIAFFFPSYDIRDQICPYIDSPKQRFWEKADMTKEDKETLLTQFKDAKQTGGLLLGVSGANFAEGIDFPGDLLQGVIIIGLPLAKPDLKTRELIHYYDSKFAKGWDYGYTFPALNKCFQSAGRCIRSETDRGAIIYLDERFAWQSYFNCFPKEGLRVSKDYIRLLNEFFNNEPKMSLK
jgi:DNA excision repair protein ERCC-2